MKLCLIYLVKTKKSPGEFVSEFSDTRIVVLVRLTHATFKCMTLMIFFHANLLDLYYMPTLS